MHYGWRAVALAVLVLALAPLNSFGDENLKTPYVMLDPASAPSPAALGKPLPSVLVNPNQIRRIPTDLGIPTITSKQKADGVEITLSNAAVSMRVNITSEGCASIEGIRNEIACEELLSGASRVFYIGGKYPISSDDFKVERWDAFQYPDYAELVVRLKSDKTEPVTWRTRVYRTRPQIEQDFETQLGDAVFGQVLSIKPSFQPVMPANLFGRGFSNGKPNIPDRRRFEVTEESEHLCYDPQTKTGMWGFVSEIGGQERISQKQFALIQNPSFRTKRSSRLGPFIIQPFTGPVEIGFLGLRQFVQNHFSVQANTPSLYEWNQFWLWQGGPTRVENSVVTEKRLLDVLPLQVKMGLEEFHLDAGWERNYGDWQLAPDRFPDGWDGIKKFNRGNGLAFHLWMNDPTTDSDDFLLDLIEKSNLYRLFMDRKVTEATVEAVEKVRARYPGFSTSCHNSTSRSAYWPWGNIHFLSDFNQVYFGEGFIFLFNPSDREQAVDWKTILWEPELELHGASVALSDWTALSSAKPLGSQALDHPTGKVQIAPRGVRVLGVNLDDKEVLARVRAERTKINY